MALKEQLFKQTAMSTANQALSMIMGLASFFLLSRILPREDIAIIGISSGFIAMFALLMITPEVLLFRDYASFKKNPKKFAESFLSFWAIRTVLVLSLMIGGAWLLYSSRGDFLLIYLLGAALVYHLNTLQASIQEFFFVEFRQKDILKMNLAYQILFLIGLGVVYMERELGVYLLLLLILTGLFSLAWVARFLKTFPVPLRFSPFVLKQDFKSVFNTSIIWNHLIGAVAQLIYRGDIFFLGFFATGFAVGNYTIALTLAGVFIFVPQILQKMCIVGLTRSAGKDGDLSIVNALVKYSILVGILQFIGFYLVGDWILSLVVPASHQEVYDIALLIVGGVNLFNAVRPLHGYAFSRSRLRQLFMEVFLPTGVFAVFAYAGAATQGVMMAAIANVLVYFVLSLLLIAFVTRRLEYRFAWQWITPAERELLLKIVRSLSRMVPGRR
jgi:O-antigen/teichoic acid export membrane protein